MKHIKAHHISRSSTSEISFPQALHPISNDNWLYQVDVNANFGIGYDAHHLYLHFEVKENHPKAVNTIINGPVWEDSCVECFISFDEEHYYNLEFNCIGNIVIGYGGLKPNRKRLESNIISSITTIPSLGKKPVQIKDTPTKWSIDIIVPIMVFSASSPKFAPAQTIRANFYKCGDKQKEPHYLSWSPINHPKPNFHLPQYFGKVTFM